MVIEADWKNFFDLETGGGGKALSCVPPHRLFSISSCGLFFLLLLLFFLFAALVSPHLNRGPAEAH